MNLNFLRYQVGEVLKKYEDTRNSDRLLCWTLWKEFYGISDFIDYKTFKDLPKESEISRYRRIWQNENGMYVPTLWDVAMGRGMEELKWKAQMLKEKDKQLSIF